MTNTYTSLPPSPKSYGGPPSPGLRRACPPKSDEGGWPDSTEARTAIEQTMTSLDAMLEKTDRHTVRHQRRMAKLARAIAVEMGLSEEHVHATQTAAEVHDIGKVCVPAEILSRPGKLSEVEFTIIKVHPRAGYDILKGIQFPGPVANIVLQHHERLDGSGYPSGLSGKDILLEARILGVADVVEAMASHRPYRPPRGLDLALEEISRGKGRLYDPRVVDACLHLFATGGFEFDRDTNGMEPEPLQRADT